MYNQESPLETLTQWYLDGTINDKVCTQAKEKAAEIKLEEAKQRVEAAEKRRLEQIEKQKPENRYPNVWRYKHVYMSELNEYLASYPLDKLEAYALELMAGKHREQFHDPDVALNYLLTKINLRKSAHPAQEIIKVTKETREEIESEQKKMKVALNDLQNTINPNSTQKMKAYTA